ncbi:Hypothetical protein CINCED_3A019424 [Cinara cedri]|uniref:Uncharacterized protein n=1 Tax=Cinara cedri TaxID=506608 RepID=A0A5E4MJV6_9HEMI|nr:Hypothetical protein CINCED_3A019424 [Cinara cedri]
MVQGYDSYEDVEKNEVAGNDGAGRRSLQIRAYDYSRICKMHGVVPDPPPYCRKGFDDARAVAGTFVPRRSAPGLSAEFAARIRRKIPFSTWTRTEDVLVILPWQQP